MLEDVGKMNITIATHKKKQYLLPRVTHSVKQGIVIVHVRLLVCLSVCLISKRVSGSSYTVENASNAALIPTSPEMKPELADVGSPTVAVLSQSSGIAAFFPHRRGHVVYNNAPFTCCTNCAVASIAIVREYSKREVCVPGTPSSCIC